jgi:hypothetical protein
LHGWLVCLQTGMMFSVEIAADVMFGLGAALVCVGSVSNFLALSQSWGDYNDLPWRARFVALNRRHPRLRGTAIACLAAALVVYIGAAVTHFA